MSITVSTASVHIVGLSPYSQSRQHDEKKLEGESHDAYDIRTWPSKMNVETRDGRKTVVIPAHGMQQAIAAAAKYSKRQIPGQGKATWTAKFTAGISLWENPPLNIDPETVRCVVISANADGVRGSGKRVVRRFPEITPWEARFDIHVLDPIITKDVCAEMLSLAGIFIGIGRFRPEKGGTCGRFEVAAFEWKDGRKLIAA